MGHDEDDTLPAPARVRSLHDRLCLGGPDKDWWEEAWALLYHPLVNQLSSRPKYRHTEAPVIADGVTDAFMEYVERPRTYDPSHGRTLDQHLELAARRNISNLFRGETRRRRREKAVADKATAEEDFVEHRTPAGNALSKEEAEQQAREHDRLFALLPDPTDRRVLELRLAGERSTAAFAAVMGIGHLPAAEQRRQVKKAKDRIDKVLRRDAHRDPPDAS